jgi:hypothetical protein
VDCTRVRFTFQSDEENALVVDYMEQSVESGGAPVALFQEEEEDLEWALEEAAKAQAETEAAAAEAKRKEEKMELLRKRAQAAMTRRKQRKKAEQ